ncbi:putative disease resistance RPP13-like protein 1 [Ricinus communis]|uniref:Leucine-rich repeat-containing protein, putative n=1 Tax=Ricinus communis TaxID=3988 RepID=B9SPM6_RICCO|nr:putative disease resistance RPP13-like protein 1 [Ricinus communis]XP_048231493.1 putative disease resistance RPP13-like protein 1 [Ricinus communis]EEF34434.1 leucine-rich repeat-containing protein, putative [Ricinus communis]|eukprot:XP_025014692.1 putative disease resistance RPP13-like protein 1 [Ricinus communis]
MTTGIVELLVIPLIGAALQVLFAKLASRGFWHLFKKRGLELKQLADLKFLVLTIIAVLTDAEEKEISNPSVKVWVDELKDAVYEAEDVLDEIFISRDQNQARNSDLKKKVEDVISRLRSVAEQKDVLGFKGLGGKTPSRLPTTSLMSEPQVFGREDEARAILEFLLPDGGNDNQIPGAIENGHVFAANENGDPVMNENEREAHENGSPAGGENGGPGNRGLDVDENGGPEDEDGVWANNHENEAPVEDNVVLLNENQVAMNQEEIPVLSIVGMPGVGKTTLAQLLFNCKTVKDNFNLRVWIHVSEEFDVLKVTKLIYHNVISGDCPTLELNKLQVSLQAAQTADLNMLQVRIQEALRGKKLLFVLDDIWNESFNHWDVLKRPFKDVASGSRIILTSRSISVASTMRAARIHHLPCLSENDCWSLFISHACRPGIDLDTEHPELKERILKKCSGLPLAATALGALLYSIEEIDEWNGVLNSEIWELPSDKCSILPVLRLSYYHLPSHLKQCFAYCSIFPKGFQFRKEHLIRLWMAQGLVRQHKNKRREEVGDECFRELLSRSFFQQFGSHDKPYFTMHDLFNDLARDVAGEFCFNFEDGTPNDIGEKIRHFSFLAEKYDVPEKFDSFKGANHLRTFLPLKLVSSQQVCALSNSALKSLLMASSHLRVLSLSPYPIPKLDDSISNLKYLRYLDLSHSLIQALPDPICSLDNLETLLLLECRNLTKLPRDMKKLINLQHLNINKTKLNKMPPQFGRLKKLHVLTDFVVGDSGSSISELKQLSDLGGALSVLNLEKVKVADAAGANLKEKKYLSELVFQWTKGIHHNALNEETVLDGLQPHENLKKLAILNYGGGNFQTWLGDASFSKMMYLRLVGCENCSSLPSLGQLSCLKEFHVANMKNLRTVGAEFCRTAASSIQPFKSLEILRFEDMPIWSSFTVEVQLPRLQKLHLHKCPNLTNKLPKHLPSLLTLHISECPNLELGFLHEDTEHWYEALKSLEISSSCNSIVFFPLDYFTKLENLQIQGCVHLKFFKHSPSPPICLQNLHIQDCCLLGSFPGGRLLSNLQSLSIKNCNNQLTPKVDWGLHEMAKLNSLEIEGPYKGIVSFPEEGLLPVNLDSLHINGFEDLRSLNNMGLQHLSRLKTLEIESCKDLNCMSVGKLPPSLACLNISDCPDMERRCKQGGAEWDKICHISKITIDGDEVN